MTWTRRRFLGTLGATAVLGLASATPACGAAVHDVDGPLTEADARRAGWTVVTDFGAVGDGRSRPLAIRYATLEAARRDYPSAVALTEEVDGVALQAAIDSGTANLFYPPGTYLHSRVLVVRDGQRHLGAGPATVLRNVRPRTDDYEWVLAHSFQVGNIHPVAMEATRAGVGWAARRLAPVAAGDRAVLLCEPLGPVRLAVGDIVMVRCDNPPFVDGEGLTYDLEVWNRVTAWDPATGRVELEVPLPRAIVDGPAAPDVAVGPTLCVNDGADYFTRQPWSIAQNVEIGRFTLDSAGFSARNGMWRCWFHDLDITGEHMLTLNAFVLSTAERIRGTWSSRMIEVKHASHSSTMRDISATYRNAPSLVAPVAPAISVGEQSYDCSFDDVHCVIGPDCRADVRALELSSSGLRFRGTLEHYGTGTNTEAWTVKSSNGPASPPVGIDLDLVVRTRPGLVAYGLIGNPVPRVSDPVDVVLRLDQRSVGAPATQGLQVGRGRGLRVLRDVGDRPTALVFPDAEAPSGVAVLVAVVSGPNGLGAGAATYLGRFPFTGPTPTDTLTTTLVATTGPTPLVAEARAVVPGAVDVTLRNPTASPVGVAPGAAVTVFVSWQPAG